uniref:Beta-lytic metalloendopeptidase n=1 Tax=Achromobacter lyticus TaxID=224 RepID=PRLB_ACHLY|nr:RecName: Full=Beta-lytic metalloendopeptidase; AltName: Full=Beta-lytic protease; Flags: Precursor [Achromobacter lyticus]AAA21906.1 beta-lytic protease [Achromobacter lyticus]
MKKISKAGLGLALVCALATIGGNAARRATAQRRGSGVFYDEMFDFDIDAHLAKHAPHLHKHSEEISHWAGYSGISRSVDRADGAAERAVTPSARRIVRSASWRAPTASARRPARSRWRCASRCTSAIPTRQGAGDAGPRQSAAGAVRAFRRQRAGGRAARRRRVPAGLRPPVQRTAPGQGGFGPLRQGRPGRAAVSPNGLLQFPFPRGASWHVGGAHTNTGSGNYPMSSLDMSRGGGWGSNQNGNWVSASAAGSFKRHSSCFAEIVHTGGWSTTYYHLMNIQYNTGANVSMNTAIANPANTQAQALCNGGQSTGPHEHWSLKQNGSFYHLNGTYLSGYRITATGSSYDTNCSRFYLTKNGQNYCYGYYVNPGPN